MSRFQPAAVGIFFFGNPGTFRLRPVPACVLLLALLSPFLAFAQTAVSASGQVFDLTDGSPVKDTRVALLGSAFSAMSDLSGNFILQHIPPGVYTLQAEAEGYQAQTIYPIDVLADGTCRVIIHLKRRSITLNNRSVVRARWPRAPTGSYEVIDQNRIAQSRVQTLPEFLDGVEGVFVQKAGVEGSAARVSIRGSDPRHVLVLVDGQRINPAGSGTADLASVPLAAVEKIEIYRGGESARFGSDAIGGVINIITRLAPGNDTASAKTGVSLGQWNSSRFDFSLNNPVKYKRLDSRVVVNGSSSDGDFPYRYAVSPQPGSARLYTGTRLNSYADSRSYFISGNYFLQPAITVGFSSQLYRSRNGLPGSVSDPDTTAWKEDWRLLTSTAFRYTPSSQGSSNITIGFSRLKQHFDNLDNPRPANRFDNRYTNDQFNLQIDHHHYFRQGNDLGGGITASRNILYHDDLYLPQMSMGRSRRDNIAAYVSDNQSFYSPLPMLHRTVIDGALRWDNTDTRKDSTSWQDPSRSSHAVNWSHKVGISLSGGEKKRVTLRASYGTSYQLPSMNALFWKGDVRSRGNPGLRPERARHADAGIEIATEGWVRLTAGMTYFHTYVKDLIVWQPGLGGVWQPVNLDSALMTGHEEFVHVTAWGKRLRIDFGNTITDARNKAPGSAAYNKYLTYRPGYVTSLNLALSYWVMNAAYDIHWVGRRYSLDANTKWYDPYRVDNLTVGAQKSFGRISVKASWCVRNLRDENYVLIGQYPMPGREWGIDVKTAYRFR